MRRSEEPGSLLSLLQRIQSRVKQFADATAVHGGNAVWLPQTHLPEFGGQILALTIVDLVHRKRDRLTRGSQHPYDTLVSIGKSNLTIHHKHHGVSKLNGNLRLRRDGGFNAFDIGFPATGIDQLEISAGPFSIVAHTVSGHAWSIFHNGRTTSENTIHQRGLANVRTSNNGKHADRLRAGLAFAPNERRSINQSFIALIQLIIIKIGRILAVLLLFNGVIDDAYKHVEGFAEIQIGIVNGQHTFRCGHEIRDLGISLVSCRNVFCANSGS